MRTQHYPLSNYLHKGKNMMFIQIFFLCMICLLSPFAQEGDRYAESNILKNGEISPVQEVITIDGQNLSFQGKVVLVNFFATWCPPCKAEMPQLQSLWERHSSKKDFLLVSIGREETAAKLIPFQKTMKIAFPVVSDPKREIYNAFAKNYIPRNYLLDRQGKVFYQSVGFTQQEFQQMVEALEKELEKEAPEKKKLQEKAEYKAPEWAKKVVWYQIFPERFCNGDPSNDPKVLDIKGSWPHDYTSPWEVHPWTSDWYKLQPYEQKNGKDIWFNIQRRRYGGDIQGILNKLDYLQQLGVGAIYLNPVFTAPSLHKYDGATYHHIDPNFGPDPEGDKALIAKEIPDDPKTWVWTKADQLMLKLISEVHSRGMKIIFDGVFNHMGINSWAFQDVLEKQQNSKFKDWFSITSWDDPEKGTKFEYNGWFGVRELPEIREDEKGIVAGPKKYIFECTHRWMDPDKDGNTSDGIDGWRLDVAFCVHHNFWKDWCRFVKSINHEAYTTAEIIDKIEVVQAYLKGDEFDAAMNYNFAFTCAEYFLQEPPISTAEFDQKLAELRAAFHPEMAYIMQNLYDSHDTNRVASHIFNRKIGSYRAWGEFFDKSRGSNPSYNTRKPQEEEREIQKLLVLFAMTYLGAPMVYYGDEAGMWGANDPCCRKPMVWKELQYEDESFLPDGTKLEKGDTVAFDQSLFDHYQKLIAIRNSCIPLQLGDFKTIATDNEKKLYAFSRTHKGESAVVIINAGKETLSYAMPLEKKDTIQDLLSNAPYTIQGNQILFSIAPRWGLILVEK